MQLDFFKTEATSHKGSHAECRSCGTTYPHTREYFHLRSTTSRVGKGTKDYLFYQCKTCRNDISKVRGILRQRYMNLRTGCCDLCSKETESLCLDHDHVTEEFRGWICNECNTGMGLLGDDIEGLERALHYLRKHDERP
jgi:hypothetical protein